MDTDVPASGRPTLRAYIERPIQADADTAVVFYLINDGPGEASLLTWGTPLESHLSADLFAIHGPDGEESAYQGRLLKRGTSNASDYLTLAAGERVSAVLILADWYAMQMPGSYSVAYRRSAATGLSLRNPQLQIIVQDTVLNVTVD